MITDKDSVIRRNTADQSLLEVISLAVKDNFERIPLTREGGLIATEISEDGTDDTMHISLTGFHADNHMMMQQITVIYFDTLAKAERFRRSPEGQGFDDPYGDGQDCFDYTTLAGNADIPKRIVTILKNYFDFTEHSHFVANTYADIHYFRKDPSDLPPKPMCC